eukprot:8695723-Pyramimonas_sp.AAC.1
MVSGAPQIIRNGSICCQQVFSGVEKELLPLFQVEDPSRFVGRSSGLEYRYATAGGALARYQPAGTAYSRALRLLHLKVSDVLIAQRDIYERRVPAWQHLYDFVRGRG